TGSAGNTTEYAIGQLRRDVEDIAGNRARPNTDAIPVDPAVTGLRHLRAVGRRSLRYVGCLILDHRDPTLLLESDLELIGDFLGSLLGPTFNLAAATRLAIDFYSAADNQSHRVAAGIGDCRR